MVRIIVREPGGISRECEGEESKLGTGGRVRNRGYELAANRQALRVLEGFENDAMSECF